MTENYGHKEEIKQKLFYTQRTYTYVCSEKNVEPVRYRTVFIQQKIYLNEENTTTTS